MANQDSLVFTQEGFQQEVLDSALPVLVDFWASWCGPCRMMGPVVEALATEYQGKIKVGKVNVDEQQGLARDYGVMTIPTLILFVGGEIKQKTIGVQPKAALEKMLNEVL